MSILKEVKFYCVRKIIEYFMSIIFALALLIFPITIILAMLDVISGYKILYDIIILIGSLVIVGIIQPKKIIISKILYYLNSKEDKFKESCKNLLFSDYEIKELISNSEFIEQCFEDKEIILKNMKNKDKIKLIKDENIVKYLSNFDFPIIEKYFKEEIELLKFENNNLDYSKFIDLMNNKKVELKQIKVKEFDIVNI